MSTIVVPTRVNGSQSLAMTFDTVENDTRSDLVTYRVILKKGDDGNYIVTSPDLQGVVTWGETEDSAIENAYEAVQAILEAKGVNEKFNLVAIIQP